MKSSLFIDVWFCLAIVEGDRNNNKDLSININRIDDLKSDSVIFQQNIVKIKNISKKLKNLLN